MTSAPEAVYGRPAETFEFFVRVYYEDTDTGGIVFYANYLKYFERARTEWLRRGADGVPGVSQQQIADDLGLMFVVRSTAVDYKRPARLDDAIRIVSTVERLGRVGIDFHQEAWSPDASGGDERLLAIGRIKVGCVSREALKPAPIPDAVRLIFTGR
ncbi:MAG: YbgC/FadM family acyl-CoA thioesterase [Burkholderiaceae bacterium]